MFTGHTGAPHASSQYMVPFHLIAQITVRSCGLRPSSPSPPFPPPPIHVHNPLASALCIQPQSIVPLPVNIPCSYTYSMYYTHTHTHTKTFSNFFKLSQTFSTKRKRYLYYKFASSCILIYSSTFKTFFEFVIVLKLRYILYNPSHDCLDLLHLPMAMLPPVCRPPPLPLHTCR